MWSCGNSGLRIREAVPYVLQKLFIFEKKQRQYHPLLNKTSLVSFAMKVIAARIETM